MNIKIDTALLDSLTVQAKASSRLWTNHDLRNSDTDTSQRILIAVEPNSKIPIHRHRKTSQTIVVVRGSVVGEFYDEYDRICEDTYVISPFGPIYGLNIPIGKWHSIRALESGTIILVMQDGAYEMIQECDILK